MFLKPVVKGLFLLSLTGVAHARVIPEGADQLEQPEPFDQFDMAEQLEQLKQLEHAVMNTQTAMAEEAELAGLTDQDELDTNDLSKSLPISYGKCYHITSDQKGYLGHDLHKLLKFSGRSQAGLFQVCKHKSSCTPNQPNKVVQNGEEFLLYDINGHEKRFIVNRGGLLGPHFGAYNNAIKFWGKKECFEDDCPIRLRGKDDRYGWDGLKINLHNYMYRFNDNSAVVVGFKETRCPY